MNFLRNGIYMGIASTAGSLAMVAAYAIVARLVPKTVFGEYQLTGTLIAIAALAAYPKMPNALITAAARKEYGTFFVAIEATAKKGMYGIGALILTASYYTWAGHYDLAVAIIISALFFIPYVIGNFYEARCVGSGKIREYALWSSIGVAACACALTVTAAATHPSAALLSLAFFGTNAATVGIWAYHASAKKTAKASPVNKEVLMYGKKTSWTESALYCANYADILLINAFLGPRAIAVYGIARMAPEGIKGLVKNFGVLSAARMATMESTAVQKMLFFRIMQAIALAFMAALAYIAITPTFFQLVFPTYPEAVLFSELLAVSFLAFPAHLAESALGALLKKRGTILLNAVSALSMLAFSLALIPPFGIFGAVMARIMARFAGAIAALILAMKSI